MVSIVLADQNELRQVKNERSTRLMPLHQIRYQLVDLSTNHARYVVRCGLTQTLLVEQLNLSKREVELFRSEFLF